jgi:hypothetical protein
LRLLRGSRRRGEICRTQSRLDDELFLKDEF